MRSIMKLFILVVMVFVLSGCNNIFEKENRVEASTDVTETKESQKEYSVKEIIYNSAGKECVLWCDPSIDFDLDEAILLAKFAEYEGGTDQEKEMIMNIVASRRNDDRFPDDIKSVLRQEGMFYINSECWNQIDLTSQRVQIAEEILKNAETYEYNCYLFKTEENLQMFQSLNLSDSKFLETENYIFYGL